MKKIQLKQILDKETIEIITKTPEQNYNDLKEISFSQKNGEKIMPYLKAIFFDQLMYYMKITDILLYNEVNSNIQENKGNAQINIEAIERTVPIIKELNKIHKWYKT